MKSVIVGTAGHIDHGKTALVKALTGIDADRLEEEKRRGITIDIGFAHLELPAPDGETLRLGFVDVPGHERFVRNMLAGIGGIDLVLLVIAADEGSSRKPANTSTSAACSPCAAASPCSPSLTSSIPRRSTSSAWKSKTSSAGTFLDPSHPRSSPSVRSPAREWTT